MVTTLSRRKSFRLLVCSNRLFAVPVHFFGRSLMCPGAEKCPACHCSRPKIYYYFAATIAKQMCAVEACSSLGRCMTEAVATLNASSARGLVVGASRASQRAMWDFDEVAYQPELASTVDDGFLIEHVGALYGIPPVVPGLDLRPTFQAWHALAKMTQIPLLSRCVLPV